MLKIFKIINQNKEQIKKNEESDDFGLDNLQASLLNSNQTKINQWQEKMRTEA